MTPQLLHPNGYFPMLKVMCSFFVPTLLHYKYFSTQSFNNRSQQTHKLHQHLHPSKRVNSRPTTTVNSSKRTSHHYTKSHEYLILSFGVTSKVRTPHCTRTTLYTPEAHESNTNYDTYSYSTT